MSFIKTIFFGDFIEGLWVTLKLMFDKRVTEQYPEEKWEPYPRFRGVPALMKDKNGEEKCIACCLCARICPSGAISTETEESKDGSKKMVEYRINIGRCIYCGLCAEICPVDAVVNSNIYDLGCYEKNFIYYDKEKLLKRGKTFKPNKKTGGRVIEGDSHALT